MIFALVLPTFKSDHEAEFVVEIDASKVGIDGVLSEP
jgi:hypothetical protein